MDPHPPGSRIPGASAAAGRASGPKGSDGCCSPAGGAGEAAPRPGGRRGCLQLAPGFGGQREQEEEEEEE